MIGIAMVMIGISMLVTMVNNDNTENDADTGDGGMMVTVVMMVTMVTVVMIVTMVMVVMLVTMVMVVAVTTTTTTIRRRRR